MIELKLAKTSLKHQMQQNLLFVFASSLMIAIVYIFTDLMQNTSLLKSSFGGAIIGLLSMGKNFSMIVTVFFMFYANSFLLRQRDRELGLYNMLGLTKGQLRLIMLFQKIYLYFLSTLGGLVIGISFVKAAFIFLKNLLQLSQLKEQFLLQPVVEVMLRFAGVFLLLLLYDFWRLKKIRPAMLWQQAAKVEKEPKANRLLGLVGLIILASGYTVAIKTKPNLSSISSFTLAVVLVVIGTYLIFITGSIVLLKLLQKNRHFYYQPQHFIAVSGMLYRMKQNAAGLATICILCTTILVALVSSVSLVAGQQRLINFWNPFDLMLTTKRPVTTASFAQLAKENHVQLQKQQQLKMTSPIIGSLSKTGEFKKVNQVSSNVSTLVSALTVQQLNQIQKTHYHLQANQILLFSADGKHYSQLKINGRRYIVKGYPNLSAGNLEHSIFQPLYIIAANQKIAEKIGSRHWIYQTGLDFSGSYQQGQSFANDIQQHFKLDNGSVSYKREIQKLLGSIFGSLLFVGILISLSMAIATALIIYYKQLSEGIADRQRFKTMQQVGLSQAESRQAIHSQVLMTFMLPIIGAVIHMCFALPALQSVLKLFSLYDEALLIKVCLLATVALIAGYLLVYGLTTKIYQHLVENQIN